MSPMVLLELQYLFEIGRLREQAETIAEDLRSRIDLALADVPFTSVARHALSVTWTRDPFDRLIVATAAAERASLLTSDEVIRRNFDLARWE